jgi:hypothetical protein
MTALPPLRGLTPFPSPPPRQRIAFKRLIERNVERDQATTAPAGSEEYKIPLPFIIINTSSQTVIQCEMTEDRSDVFFNFR